jgi:CBS domain-containing protein
VNLNEPITQIMSTDVHSVNSRQLISDARALMTRHLIHHVPVVDGGKLVGLLSATDVIALGFGEQPEGSAPIAAYIDSRFSLEDVMQRDLITIGSEQPIRKAAELLSSGSFHALPVVGPDSELLGMVTSTDLVRLLRDME